jgi:DNA-binding GntR family transcriptional regulator
MPADAAVLTTTLGMRRSLVDDAILVLRESILDGSIPPSGRIRLTTVADQLNMSPIPVREALRILMQEGLVELIPRRGYRVRPVSLEDLADTYLVRKHLDSFAVRQAVGRIETREIDRLEGLLVLLGQAAEANDQARRRVLHREVHFGLYEAAGSPWLLRLLSTLWENSDRYQRLSSRVRGSASSFVEEHGRILRAVRDRDPDSAEARMREHLQRTEDSVRGVLKGRFGESA